MAKRKKTKYNNGGLVSKTVKTSVADLNLNYEPPSKRYSADVRTKTTGVGVRGRGVNLPSSVQGSVRIGGAEVQGRYNFKSGQTNVTVTKPLSKTSNIQAKYDSKTGIQAMYNKRIPFGK